MIRQLTKIAIGCTLAIAAVSPAWSAGLSTEVAGVVRDSGGAPQMGALVQLIGGGSQVIAQAYTNLRGGFSFEHIVPGTYEMKASGASFLPTLRENLRLNGKKTVVNLTLNTLFEAIEWLPAEPRSPDEPSDDWKWTLRSSTNRPLLRFLEDGPLVVVTGGESQPGPQLEARVSLQTASREFGESDPHGAFELERSNSDQGHLILRADLGPDPGIDNQYLAGYEQPLGPGREIRTLAAVQNIGDIRGPGGQQNFTTFMLRGAESVNMGPQVSISFGNQVEAVQGPNQVVTGLPFADLSWHSDGGTVVAYSIATSPALQGADQLADNDSLAPQYSESGGLLRIQSGLHQEFRVEQDGSSLRVMAALFRDQIDNPIVSGGGYPFSGEFADGNLLYDPLAEVLRATGPNYGGSGLRAETAKKIGTAWVSIAYAQGAALVSPIPSSKLTVTQALGALLSQPSEAVTGAVSGRLNRAGTYVRASYRWQPADTVTAVDPFDDFTQEAFFNLFIRQPIHLGGLFPNGTEALISVRNLLEQGYRPFLTPDGSALYFAQTDRAIEGGLSFSF